MVYSDSHAHLADYAPRQVKMIIELMRQRQVEIALAVSVTIENSQATIKLAETYDEIKAAVGFHPWFATALTPEMKDRFQQLASSKSVRAIGEIGLDYTPPRMESAKEKSTEGPSKVLPKMQFPKNMPPLPPKPASPEIQKELFCFALSTANKLGLPVNVHSRGGAHQDMMEILRQKENRGVKGIAHSFDLDPNILRDWLDLGFYITLGAMPLMVESNSAIDNFVKSVPLDQMVVETDANPMLSPINGPVDVIPVVQKIASIRGCAAEDIGNATTFNLKRVLKL